MVVRDVSGEFYKLVSLMESKGYISEEDVKWILGLNTNQVKKKKLKKKVD